MSVVARKVENTAAAAAVVVMRRMARRLIWPAARGGWAGDVTGGLRRTSPTGSLFSTILSMRARG